MRNATSGLRLTTLLCLAGGGLMFLPADSAGPCRALVRDGLRPGQALLRSALARTRAWVAALRPAAASAASANERSAELRQARLENRRLEVQVARLVAQVHKLSADQQIARASGAWPPLVKSRLVEARVLGEETAALWRARKLLSSGSSDGIAESALVLDDTRLLVDLGADAGLAPGDAAYAGRVVLGKIAEVGNYTSTLRHVTDPAYSGRARLARRTSRGLEFGAEGTIVGTGGELCRLLHIGDPVNVGDEVFTGGTDGAVPYPMYYGKVVRSELEAGANDWSVWVEPAANSERLESVLILRRELNADRILAN